MNSLTIWSGLLLLALVAVIWFLRRRSRAAIGRDEADRLDTVAAWPPTATRIMSSKESQAYKTLVRALPEYMILAKVPLARFVKVPSRHSYSEWLRRLGNQCADLVVCDLASVVIAVVSVRRPAGEASERASKRHKRMARVMKAARIPLHEWSDSALPAAERARELLLPRPAAAFLFSHPPAASTPSRPGPPETVGTVDADAPRGGRDEAKEPPPSTWFDEFNSGPAPLQPTGKKDLELLR